MRLCIADKKLARCGSAWLEGKRDAHLADRGRRLSGYPQHGDSKRGGNKKGSIVVDHDGDDGNHDDDDDDDGDVSRCRGS